MEGFRGRNGGRGSFGGRGGFGGRGRSDGGFGDRFAPKPVKIDEEYDVEIESVAEKGDGIAKVKGLIVFVPGAQKGEKIKIKIKEIKSRCAIGEKIGEGSETTESSSDLDSESDSAETSDESSGNDSTVESSEGSGDESYFSEPESQEEEYTD